MQQHDPAATPAVRRYSVPFHEVWSEALALVDRTRGWTLLETDPRAGTMVVEERPRLIGRRLRFTLALTLDELGLTRVDAAVAGPAGEPLVRIRRGAVERILRRLDRALLRSRGG